MIALGRGFLELIIRALNWCFIRGGGAGKKKKKDKKKSSPHSAVQLQISITLSNEGVSTEHTLFSETLLSSNSRDLHL